MPSAPRLVGRPSVPRALAMPIWGLLASSAQGFRPRRPVFAQDAGGFRFHLVPDLRLRKIFRLVNVRPNRHRPTSSLLRATSSRKATAFRARRAQNGRAIRVQRRELGSGRTNVVAPRSTLLLPNRYPRLVCALALQNDPPDFWRRGGQKGRSRALGQRFARMPP